MKYEPFDANAVIEINYSWRRYRNEKNMYTGLRIQRTNSNLKPGVTELQMVGIAQRVIYENGAEYEGLPMYVFSEESTRHAISRSRYREIKKGDIVQLNLSAKIDGYSPSIGLPKDMCGYVGPLETQYAMKLTSNTNIVVQYGRLDNRQTNLAYYTTLAY